MRFQVRKVGRAALKRGCIFRIEAIIYTYFSKHYFSKDFWIYRLIEVLYIYLS